MNWGHAAVLGVVQGVTEFLPVSSGAHLRVVAGLAGWRDPGAEFTAVTRLGAETAVLVYLRRDVVAVTRAWSLALVRREARKDPDARLGWCVLAGSVPIGLLAPAFQNTVDAALHDLRVVAVTVIVFGLLLGLADRAAPNAKPLTELGVRGALALGLAQSLSLIPGVSRPGGTITAGLLMGYRREAAARYSFLLALPALSVSGLLELVRAGGSGAAPAWGPTALATAITFGVGYAVIAWLLRFLTTHTFGGFAVYRVAAGLVVLALLAAGTVPAAG